MISKKLKPIAIFVFHKIYKILVNQKFIYKNSLYKRYLISKYTKYYGERRNLNKTNSIEIELTNRCNLKCIFCPHPEHKRDKGVMDFPTFKKIFDDLNNSVDMIILGGFGEAILDKNIIEKLRYLRSNVKHKNIELVTNAIALNDDFIHTVISESLLDKLNISVDSSTKDGYERVHRANSFNKVYSNIKNFYELKSKINKNKPIVSLRFKDAEFNKGEFINFVKIFSNISDEIKPYAFVFEWPDSNLNISEVDISKSIRIPCPNLWDLRVNWNGDAILCCQDYDGRIKLGNTNQLNISDIYENSKVLNFYREKHQKLDFDIPVCKSCEINTNRVFPI